MAAKQDGSMTPEEIAEKEAAITKAEARLADLKNSVVKGKKRVKE